MKRKPSSSPGIAVSLQYFAAKCIHSELSRMDDQHLESLGFLM